MEWPGCALLCGYKAPICGRCMNSYVIMCLCGPVGQSIAWFLFAKVPSSFLLFLVLQQYYCAIKGPTKLVLIIVCWLKLTNTEWLLTQCTKYWVKSLWITWYNPEVCTEFMEYCIVINDCTEFPVLYCSVMSTQYPYSVLSVLNTSQYWSTQYSVVLNHYFLLSHPRINCSL